MVTFEVEELAEEIEEKIERGNIREDRLDECEYVAGFSHACERVSAETVVVGVRRRLRGVSPCCVGAAKAAIAALYAVCRKRWRWSARACKAWASFRARTAQYHYCRGLVPYGRCEQPPDYICRDAAVVGLDETKCLDNNTDRDVLFGYVTVCVDCSTFMAGMWAEALVDVASCFMEWAREIPTCLNTAKAQDMMVDAYESESPVAAVRKRRRDLEAMDIACFIARAVEFWEVPWVEEWRHACKVAECFKALAAARTPLDVYLEALEDCRDALYDWLTEERTLPVWDRRMFMMFAVGTWEAALEGRLSLELLSYFRSIVYPLSDYYLSIWRDNPDHYAELLELVARVARGEPVARVVDDLERWARRRGYSLRAVYNNIYYLERAARRLIELGVPVRDAWALVEVRRELDRRR